MGRWDRDRAIAGQTRDEVHAYRRGRSVNESLNGEFEKLSKDPQRGGARAMLQVHLLSSLTLFAVQLVRAQHGVRRGLCLISYIV